MQKRVQRYYNYMDYTNILAKKVFNNFEKVFQNKNAMR